jgi:urease alpha subunit
MQNLTNAVNNVINVNSANTSKVPGMYPTNSSVLALLANASFAEEWSTTTHPTHIVLKIAAIYNRHVAEHADIWNDDWALETVIAEIEEHAELVDYINNVALQDAVFVYDCLCCSGL